MATRVDAINALRPRLVLKPAAKMEQLVEFISGQTEVEIGVVQKVLEELNAAVLHFARQGMPVAIEGLGMYAPSIDLSGEFDCLHRPDRQIVLGLNQPGVNNAEVVNQDNIGKATKELIALWNEMHPDDPVE